jgi:hypothetical protein
MVVDYFYESNTGTGNTKTGFFSLKLRMVYYTLLGYTYHYVIIIRLAHKKINLVCAAGPKKFYKLWNV